MKASEVMRIITLVCAVIPLGLCVAVLDGGEPGLRWALAAAALGTFTGYELYSTLARAGR